MKPNSDYHFNQMTSSEPFKASGPTMVSVRLDEWEAKKQLLSIKTHLLESAEKEVDELKDALRLALQELIRLGAEDNNDELGKNPVCEQVRAALKETA